MIPTPVFLPLVIALAPASPCAQPGVPVSAASPVATPAPTPTPTPTPTPAGAGPASRQRALDRLRGSSARCPLHSQPGILDRASIIAVPDHVAAGGWLIGKVPAGSAVTIDGRKILPGPSGDLRWRVPRAMAGRSVLMTIAAPGRSAPPMQWRISVTRNN